MTQVFVGGDCVAVTVLQLGPNVVVNQRKASGKDGYNALQLGFEDRSHKNLSKAMTGFYKKSDVKPKRVLREFRVEDEAKVEAYATGQEIKADFFSEGQWIDVTGTSKGKGFQGVMKRHGMKGSKQKTHGTHEYFRHVGSIGCRSTPGEVHRGKRMPGHMGVERVTIQNLRIVKIDVENNVVLVRGAVPGSANGFVVVRPAIKKLNKAAA